MACLCRAQRQLSECTSQSEICRQFLKLSEPFAESCFLCLESRWSRAVEGARQRGISRNGFRRKRLIRSSTSRRSSSETRSVAAVCAAPSLQSRVARFPAASCFERAIEVFRTEAESARGRLRQSRERSRRRETASACLTSRFHTRPHYSPNPSFEK